MYSHRCIGKVNKYYLIKSLSLVLNIPGYHGNNRSIYITFEHVCLCMCILRGGMSDELEEGGGGLY